MICVCFLLFCSFLYVLFVVFMFCLCYHLQFLTRDVVSIGIAIRGIDEVRRVNTARCPCISSQCSTTGVTSTVVYSDING